MNNQTLTERIESILDEHHFKDCRSEVLFQLKAAFKEYVEKEIIGEDEMLTREHAANILAQNVLRAEQREKLKGME